MNSECISEFKKRSVSVRGENTCVFFDSFIELSSDTISPYCTAPLDARSLMDMQEGERMVLLVRSRLGPHVGTLDFLDWCEIMLGKNWMANLSRELYAISKTIMSLEREAVREKRVFDEKEEDLDQQLLMCERENWDIQRQNLITQHLIYDAMGYGRHLSFIADRKEFLNTELKKAFFNNGNGTRVVKVNEKGYMDRPSLEVYVMEARNYYFDVFICLSSR